MTQMEDNSKKFLELRDEYPVFKYLNYDFEFDHANKNLQISFSFECGTYKFNPKMEILCPKNFIRNIQKMKSKLNLLIFNIGMVELISYWKLFASPNVEIYCGALNVKQIKFWKKLYFNGLGEYFHLNNISTSLDSFMQITTHGYGYKKFTFKHDSKDVILPIGGGKDSIVSLELLKNKGFNITPLVINPRKATDKCIELSNFSKSFWFKIQRHLDPLMLELNQKGFLNGHTPFSALIAFTSLLTAFINKTSHIVLSNENSANEETIIGQNINHQYSKSIEFENDFRKYVKTSISESFNYFSLLRPLSELQIAQIFSMYNQYHSVFRSCNAGSKEDSWCLNCPKCLFAYIILSPFITQERLVEIFGENLLDKESLKDYFSALIGMKEEKPFECVGTINEVNIALALLIQRYPQAKELSLIKYWRSFSANRDFEKNNYEKELYTISKKHNITRGFSSIFSNPYAIYKKAEIVRYLSEYDNIIIYGFGKEGLATYQLLKKLVPHKRFVIQDQNLKIRHQNPIREDFKQYNIKTHLGDSSYETHISKNGKDIVFVSPGVDLKSMRSNEYERIVTSQTDLFLKLFYKQTIGITGTKGKSTTSTLTYDIIKNKTNNVFLAGNIGTPSFDLIDKINEDSIIVLELSAHQLQYITVAPKVSVLLNIYEEHLDRFHSFEAYQNAKLNILFCQDNRNIRSVFIYNSSDEIINKTIKKLRTNSKLIGVNLNSYEKSPFLNQEPDYLKGVHNKFNIVCAYYAAKAMKMENENGLKSVLSFKGLPNRMQFVETINGVDYYNDSISTIPQATLAALDALGNVETLILGGMDRGIDYSILKNILFDYPSLKNIAFVGKAGKRMKKIIKKNSKKKSLFLDTNNYKEIVQWCIRITESGSTVLLSPAAASYDQFKNFEKRGEKFSSLVKNTIK
ncbi:MAG: UDP-N-acetylmuramoyl-L-alanine--D-glutamate ligase [Bacteroidales bacterium]|jgi:UDP-N-acetylmuramoylalanine--D-glutamate ligase|nr:UDP-N-acetylmuramoyl-L-alanine--D-glutamate ligase [Bacteroidales bacterium]